MFNCLRGSDNYLRTEGGYYVFMHHDNLKTIDYNIQKIQLVSFKEEIILQRNRCQALKQD